MRGKRSKQYRKLMQQYSLTFGFREPYQVLVDAGMLEDAVVRFKMDFANILSRTLHGQVKPMITQCTIRQLYNLQTVTASHGGNSNEKPGLTQANKTAILDAARACEKRRCDHHELDAPLSTLECWKSVIDPKDSSTNKHRYILACQDEAVRQWARGIRGIPMVYVKRSVMIMEPMTELSVGVKQSAEKEKLRSGVKRKRGESKGTEPATDGADVASKSPAEADGALLKKAKMTKGPKGPNPLSMRKAKKRSGTSEAQSEQPGNSDGDDDGDGDASNSTKKRRRRRHGRASDMVSNVEVMQAANDGDD